MKLQARNFVVRKPKTVDITVFFKKFCIATRTSQSKVRFALIFLPHQEMTFKAPCKPFVKTSLKPIFASL